MLLHSEHTAQERKTIQKRMCPTMVVGKKSVSSSTVSVATAGVVCLQCPNHRVSRDCQNAVASLTDQLYGILAWQ